MKNYLEINVVRFIHLLRHAGIRIGSGEVIDALQALTLMDLSDREAVRAALKATLVKRPGEQQVFDKAFDIFFAPPEMQQERQADYQQKQEYRQQMLDEATEDLSFQGTPMDISDQEKTVYASIPEQDREKLQDYINKTAGGKNVEEHFRPLLESVVKGSLSYWRKNLRNEIDLSEAPKTGDEELDAMVEGVGSGGGDGSLLEEDMQNIADKDVPRARALIRKLARQMVARISRRYRQSKKHKQLDLRKSIRHNIRFGGTMFRLRYRSRRIQKPKIVLICDVSGSMARYASFVMQFIYGIHDVVGSIESFVFSEDVERVTGYFQHGSDFNATMLEVVNRSTEWGRGTNLGASLKSLRQKYPDALSGQSYVLIVSDTKTMALEDSVQELEQIKRIVKDVIWLNTLPDDEWDGKSVQMFQKIVRMYPCNTLSDLEKVMRQKIIA
ncbi:vWA domain-containing protein [Dethiobacter alkaliphilus]|uniref:VWA containing CoxE family protein n=1 Tax=Dethiobacter alkaliphilus AHT 1 TaxID=555088 RepID=C0GF66_DETAL|nr:VWA domain-containing protein [Dethiobacter alkaliphilus]EEG77826.1 VWA containing CoxE family protein [Dethiobacter alkaliphilus AHT 1]